MKKMIRTLLILMMLFLQILLNGCSDQNYGILKDDERHADVPNSQTTEEDRSENVDVFGKINDIGYYNNSIIYLVNNNQFYINQKDAASDTNIMSWTEFPMGSLGDRTILDFEIKGQLMYVHAKNPKNENYLITYDIKNKKILKEQKFEQTFHLSNLVYKNQYMERMCYAKTLHDKKVAYIVMNTLEFNSHLDVLKIGLPSEKAYVSWIDVSPDLKYVVYTIADPVTNRTNTFIHDLTSNHSEVLKDQIFLPHFIANDLYSFSSHDLSKETVRIQVPYHVRKEQLDQGKSNVVYDLVIKNGIVIDPETETIKFGYHVGILKDKVVKITRNDIKGKKVIDATHKIVSPGFIDILSFNPNPVAAKYKIGDGVTTNLSMHGCTVDYDGFFKHYEKHPTMVNYGGALFAAKLRFEQGLGIHKVANAEQIRRMQERAREEIRKGAIAIAFSPEYYPGTTPEEIKAIMKVGKEFGLVSHFHGRYSAITGEHTGIDTVKEVLSYARELKAPVHFMHLHSTGGTGVMNEALALIEKARAEGYQVTYDIYPYDSWASNINMARFSGDWQTRYGITYSDLQIAGQKGRLTEKTFKEFKKKGGTLIAFALNEDEMIQAMQVEHSMIGSDSTIESENANNHPRGAGTFARFIGRYIRDKDVLPFMDGMKKITILPAKHLDNLAPALRTRGRLQVGSTADITIFDYDKIIDTATPEKPNSLSKGIEYVIVSGQIVKDPKGINSKARFGKPIKGVFQK